MILWEMATMTKPFETMGREQFLQQVVSSWSYRPSWTNLVRRRSWHSLELAETNEIRNAKLRFGEAYVAAGPLHTCQVCSARYA